MRRVPDVRLPVFLVPAKSTVCQLQERQSVLANLITEPDSLGPEVVGESHIIESNHWIIKTNDNHSEGRNRTTEKPNISSSDS